MHLLIFCGHFRWEDLLQELKVEHKNTGETLSLWQEYYQLSESCALRLKHLSHQREELLSSSLSPQRDTQATSLSGEVSDIIRVSSAGLSSPTQECHFNKFSILKIKNQ